MIFQYHGKISIALGPRKHFPSISFPAKRQDRFEVSQCKLHVRDGCGQRHLKFNGFNGGCNGCCWMLIYEIDLWTYGFAQCCVHQEPSGLSSCSIQPKTMVLVVSHILTQRNTPIVWIILMSLASETMIIMEFTMQLDSCTCLLKQAFKSQMFCP